MTRAAGPAPTVVGAVPPQEAVILTLEGVVLDDFDAPPEGDWTASTVGGAVRVYPGAAQLLRRLRAGGCRWAWSPAAIGPTWTR